MPELLPLKLLLATFAGWVNRRQAQVVDYLVEENRVLKEQLRGRQLRLTDDQRRRLAAKGKVLGRDHFPDCFSLFLTGGGIRRGLTYGESDELGFRVARDPVGIHDLQATILHLMGFDHTRLTYRFQGRDYRLTDVHGEVVEGLLA